VGLRIGSLLAQIPEGDPSKRKLRTIERDLERMGDLVNNAFDIAVPREGPFCFVDVSEEIEKVLELVQFHLLTHRLTVVREFSPELPPILGDCQQLRRLFFHLFIHIIGRLERGGAVTVRLHVEKGRGEEGGEYAVAEIRGNCRNGSLQRESARSTTIAQERPSGEWSAVLALCRSITKGHRGTLNIGTRSGAQSDTVMRIALPVSSC
jgi:two-component system NtrC family sensor kinase